MENFKVIITKNKKQYVFEFNNHGEAFGYYFEELKRMAQHIALIDGKAKIQFLAPNGEILKEFKMTSTKTY